MNEMAKNLLWKYQSLNYSKILESKQTLFLLQNPKNAIPGSVYQREGIKDPKGRARKTEHPLGIRHTLASDSLSGLASVFLFLRFY